VYLFRKQIICVLFILNGLNASGQKTGCLEIKSSSFFNNIKENELEKTYDKNGNLLVYTETNFSNNIKSYSKKTENEYDYKNRLIKTTSYINDKEINRNTRQYDSPDFLVKESINQNSQTITINKNNITYDDILTDNIIKRYCK
jgi:antitoxin component YwqK of YwqJK toxin-antitoxin module